MEKSQKTLYIIDGYNLIFRMFYAVPEFRTREGKVVNAIFGVTKSLLQILREDKPTHMFVAFDVGSDTFRKDLYEDYKSNRDRMPDALSDQIEDIIHVFTLLDIPQIGIPGYEADDIIGSMTNHPEIEEFDRVLICSSDKDLFQFIDEDRIRVYDMMKKRVFSRKEAVEKFGVRPEFVVDYLALVGDSSDMIPGVAGIGPKGASKLINEYGNLESIYDHLDDITGSTHKKLSESRDMAFLSKRLATIDTSLDLSKLTGTNMEVRADFDEVFSDTFVDFLIENEFSSLIPEGKKPQTQVHFDFNILDLEKGSDIDGFFAKVHKANKLCIRTGGGRNTLDALALTIDGDEVLFLESNQLELLRVAAKHVLELPESVVLGGYDIKMDLRRIRFFLDSSEVLEDALRLF